MDQFMKGMHPFDRMSFNAPTADAEKASATQSANGDLKSRFSINRGATSGLADKSSKVASQDRLFMAFRSFGSSCVGLAAELNVAFFTPIEFSFGKMTAMTMNGMMFCLNVYETEQKKKEKHDKNAKENALKRAGSLAKKCGAIIGFAGMAVLMGAVGSIAAGSAFSIYNSRSVQEEED